MLLNAFLANFPISPATYKISDSPTHLTVLYSCLL